MGLIDEIRDARDSWARRLEEQRATREEYDHEYEKRNERKTARRIEKNRSMVGRFPPSERNS